MVQLYAFLNYMDIFGFTPDISGAQLQVFQGLEKLSAAQRDKSIVKALARKLKIAI